MVSYNVEGLRILYNQEVCAFLNDFDLIICVETFAATLPESILEMFPNYKIYISPAIEVNDASTARLSGGVLVLVKRSLLNFVEKVHVEYDNTIALKIDKSLFGFDRM